jgi:hypothetical protein
MSAARFPVLAALRLRHSLRKDIGPSLTRAAELHSTTSALRRKARFGLYAFAGRFNSLGTRKRVARITLRSVSPKTRTNEYRPMTQPYESYSTVMRSFGPRAHPIGWLVPQDQTSVD